VRVNNKNIYYSYQITAELHHQKQGDNEKASEYDFKNKIIFIFIRQIVTANAKDAKQKKEYPQNSRTRHTHSPTQSHFIQISAITKFA